MQKKFLLCYNYDVSVFNLVITKKTVALINTKEVEEC